MGDDLRFGPLGPRVVHLCVDMQRLFSDDGPWPMPWMDRALPMACRLAEHAPERTIFTRFIPPRRPEDRPGTWQRYYARWREVTRERVDPALIELMPPLACLVPPAIVVDKPGYSAFSGGRLDRLLAARGVDGLVVSGGETDVCIAATVLAAVDRGYRVVLAADAVCSSSDAGHDHVLDVYRRRFGQQIETADSETILSAWDIGSLGRG